MVVLVLLALMVGLGVFHHYSLIVLMRVLPGWAHTHKLRAMPIFGGMAVVHALEILAFAGVYVLLTATLWPDSFSPSFAGSFEDYVYFSAVMYTTLGYAPFDAEGPMRLIAAGQSLLGFMTLTWSATFLYSMCSDEWHEEAERSKNGGKAGTETEGEEG
ncbi:MAG: ion channel [Oceanicaulis sp.]